MPEVPSLASGGVQMYEKKTTRSGSIREADLIPAWGGLIKASGTCHFCMTFGRLERWQEECSRQRGNRWKLLMGAMPRVAASLGYFNPEGIVGAQGELRGGTERPCREAAAAEQDLGCQAEEPACLFCVFFVSRVIMEDLRDVE